MRLNFIYNLAGKILSGEGSHFSLSFFTPPHFCRKYRWKYLADGWILTLVAASFLLGGVFIPSAVGQTVELVLTSSLLHVDRTKEIGRYGDKAFDKPDHELQSDGGISPMDFRGSDNRHVVGDGYAAYKDVNTSRPIAHVTANQRGENVQVRTSDGSGASPDGSTFEPRGSSLVHLSPGQSIKAAFHDRANLTGSGVAPTVTISGVPDKINFTGQLFNVTFTFSEDVTEFTKTDIELTGGLSGAFRRSSNRRYTLPIFTIS